MKSDTSQLTLLGHKTVYKQDYAPEVLETFINKHPENDYWVRFNCPEFTSLCPITGQPDFATIQIDYIPGEHMVESKSLKLYLFSFRNHFCELSHDNKAAGTARCTGGKGQHLITGSYRNIRFYHGTVRHSRKPGRIGSVIFPFHPPGRSITAGFFWFCLKRCENITEIAAIRRYKIHLRVAVIITLFSLREANMEPSRML